MPIVSSVVATGRVMNGADGFTVPRSSVWPAAKSVPNQLVDLAVKPASDASLPPTRRAPFAHDGTGRFPNFDYSAAQSCRAVAPVGISSLPRVCRYYNDCDKTRWLRSKVAVQCVLVIECRFDNALKARPTAMGYSTMICPDIQGCGVQI